MKIKIPLILRASSHSDRVSGLDVNLLGRAVEQVSGLGISGIANLSAYSKGVEFAFGGNFSGCDSDGLRVGGVFNYAGGVERGLVQISLLGNKVEEVDDKAFVLQFGFYNVIGKQVCPIVNVRGLRRLLGGKN